MLRWLYIQLIWLHPAPFRWRFGDDMLDDFDHAPNHAKVRYLADAFASILRQWLFRPEFRRPETFAPAPAGPPMFQTFESHKPRTAVLLQGGVLAALSILIAVDLIGKGGGTMAFLIDPHYFGSALIPVDRNAAAERDPSTSAKRGPDSANATLKLARLYFESMPVLRALDTDHDFALSPWEINHAPAALRTLDSNHTGAVTVEDIGLHLTPKPVPPVMRERFRRQFMSTHPVLNALDADHDGQVSAWEIDHASAALQKLDSNHDGYLTAGELLPFKAAVNGGLR